VSVVSACWVALGKPAFASERGFNRRWRAVCCCSLVRSSGRAASVSLNGVQILMVFRDADVAIRGHLGAPLFCTSFQLHQLLSYMLRWAEIIPSSKQSFQQLFAMDARERALAHAVLVRASEIFDSRCGTAIAPAIRRNIREGIWGF